MLDDFRDRILKALKDERASLLSSLVQLKCSSMQQLGEMHTMLAAKVDGLNLAEARVTDIYNELTGVKPEPEEKETGVYE
jgi:hypothetical protein